MRVGILAVQGAFEAHAAALAELGHATVHIRDAEALESCDGLVLPGGESTTQRMLLERHGLAGAIDSFVRSGRPVLATCAGLILAARRVTHPEQASFGWIDVEVARNAWGRQLDSFEATSDPGENEPPLPLVFIRAPRIRAVGAGCRVLARYRGEPILVNQGKVMGSTFHPELTSDRRIYQRVFEGPAVPS